MIRFDLISEEKNTLDYKILIIHLENQHQLEIVDMSHLLEHYIQLIQENQKLFQDIFTSLIILLGFNGIFDGG